MATADTAKLLASLSLKDNGFSSGLSKAEKGLGKFESTAFRVGQNIGKGVKNTVNNLTKLGSIAAVGAVGIIAKSVGEASDLNEQISKNTVVFGESSKAVLDWSKTTAASLGLAQSEALEATGALGNMFKTTGLADDAAADMSKNIVQLAADMASFNNEDPSEMLDKLRSGLSGEAEPLRRFGVLLSEAAVAEEAYATGIAERGKKLTEAQKVQARYSLILKQTAVQQGDFARTSGSLANQQRILAANLRNAGATIGTALLPKITELAVKLNKLITENQPAVIAFADKLPGAFDKAVAFAEKIPWNTIASGLEAATMWAGKLFDVFLNLPPEVQTTIIALAGLNKLSGGAVTGIASELAKGAIKGVLGINAAQVNITAANVTGVGGGVPGAAPGGGGGALGSLFRFVGGALLITGVVEGAVQVTNFPANINPKTGLVTRGGSDAADPNSRLEHLLSAQVILAERAAGGDKDAQRKLAQINLEIAQLRGLTGKNVSETASRQNIANERLESIKGFTSEQSRAVSQLLASSERNESADAQRHTSAQAAAFAIRDGQVRGFTFVNQAVNAVKTATEATRAAAAHAGQQTAAAIRDKDLSVDVRNTVNVSTSISVKSTIGATQKVNKYTTIL